MQETRPLMAISRLWFLAALVALLDWELPVSANSIMVQEEDCGCQVDQWIRDLSAEQLDVRDKASRKLIERGKSVLPHLRRALRSKDRERISRVKWIIAQVEYNARVSNGIPLVRTVTLNEKASLLRDVLTRIRNQTGYYDISADEVLPETRIRHIAWKNTPVLEALAELASRMEDVEVRIEGGSIRLIKLKRVLGRRIAQAKGPVLFHVVHRKNAAQLNFGVALEPAHRRAWIAEVVLEAVLVGPLRMVWKRSTRWLPPGQEYATHGLLPPARGLGERVRARVNVYYALRTSRIRLTSSFEKKTRQTSDGLEISHRVLKNRAGRVLIEIAVRALRDSKRLRNIMRFLQVRRDFGLRDSENRPMEPRGTIEYRRRWNEFRFQNWIVHDGKPVHSEFDIVLESSVRAFEFRLNGGSSR